MVPFGFSVLRKTVFIHMADYHIHFDDFFLFATDFPLWGLNWIYLLVNKLLLVTDHINLKTFEIFIWHHPLFLYLCISGWGVACVSMLCFAYCWFGYVFWIFLIFVLSNLLMNAQSVVPLGDEETNCFLNRLLPALPARKIRKRNEREDPAQQQTLFWTSLEGLWLVRPKSWQITQQPKNSTSYISPSLEWRQLFGLGHFKEVMIRQVGWVIPRMW